MKGIRNKPQITVSFSQDEMRRIVDGPLGLTHGIGRQKWLYNIAISALTRWEDEIMTIQSPRGAS